VVLTLSPSWSGLSHSQSFLKQIEEGPLQVRVFQLALSW